jgi:hypothetical protein
VSPSAGRSAAWLARQSGGLEVPSSNLGAPTAQPSRLRATPHRPLVPDRCPNARRRRPERLACGRSSPVAGVRKGGRFGRRWYPLARLYERLTARPRWLSQAGNVCPRRGRFQGGPAPCLTRWERPATEPATTSPELRHGENYVERGETASRPVRRGGRVTVRRAATGRGSVIVPGRGRLSRAHSGTSLMASCDWN